MGRGAGSSAGSSAGSHRSSGGGSHSRSFGGTSSHSSRGGGSSRSYSRGGVSHSSGPHVSGSYHHHTYHHHHYGPGYSRTYVYGGAGGRILSTFITLFVLMFMLVVLFLAVSENSGNITKSTVEREALKPYASFNKDCYDDQAGWIHDRKTLLKGMESFYKKTGVQPALVICEDINGERYVRDSVVESCMEQEYDELIGHERGVLLLFAEYADSDWYAYYMAGGDAQTVMDSEACDILIDYVHSCYTNQSYSDEEFFSAVFEKTGSRIMEKTPTVASKIPVMVFGLVIIIAIFAGLKALKMRHKREAERAAETERILNSDINHI